MYSFAGTVLGDDPWLAKIHLAGDTLHQSLGTGDDRCDLKRSFQKLFEKQGTHETRTVVLHIEVVQSRSGRTNGRISTAAGNFLAEGQIARLAADISLDSSLVPDQLSLLMSAVSSVVEHYLDTVGVRGSNPLSRTIFPPSTRGTYPISPKCWIADCNTLL